MTPKLQGLLDKMRDVTASIEGRAEKLVQRLEKADQSSATADARTHAELDKIEEATRGIENFINQLSNGGPPLGDSGSSSQ